MLVVVSSEVVVVVDVVGDVGIMVVFNFDEC